MSAALSPPSTRSIYHGSPETPSTLPNDRIPSLHLHRYVETPYFVAPKETGVEAIRPPLSACGLRPNMTWSGYYQHFEELKKKHAPQVRLKTFYFLRHAQGLHNEAEAKFGTAVWDAVESLKDEYTDPDLTVKGVAQCEAFNAVLPSALSNGFKPELIITSPLKRTLRTAELCLKSACYDSLPVISVEHARETLGEHTCDRRSTITEMKKVFPDVQFHFIVDDVDPLWTTTRETDDLEIVRAQRFMDFLWTLPEEHIILVNHSGMLTALANLFWKPLREDEIQAPIAIHSASASVAPASSDEVLSFLKRDGALSNDGISCRHCELQPFCVARLPLGAGSISLSPEAPLSSRLLSSASPRPRTIGFATSSDHPNLSGDEQHVLPHLKKLGVTVKPIVWDGEHSLEGLDGLILRSCWNYHHKSDQFQIWLSTVEKYSKAHNLKVANPIDANRWNLNKSYLLAMGSTGALVPQTRYLTAKSSPDAVLSAITSLVESSQAKKLVLKPAISASGDDTYLHDLTTGNSSPIVARATELMHTHSRDILIQEFLPEIGATGECSFIFFNGAFSHAIRKVPQIDRGEFRVQEEYGGVQKEYQPTKHFIKKAREYLAHIPEYEKVLCCRVDAIERGDQLVLMELEVIDPSLYMRLAPGSAERFAQAIDECF